MGWKWLTNRFVVTFGSIALATLAWNVYIAYHDNGLIEGHIVGPDGQPVEGAKVTLSERTLLVAQPKGNVTTDADGRFQFTGHTLHRLYLEARKEGVGRFGPREFRLYFKGEDLILDKPLALEAS